MPVKKLVAKALGKVTKKKFQRLTPSDIGKMKVPELRELIRGARKLFDEQAKKFAKYESTVYSHSLEKMNDYYEENKKAPSRMKLSQLRAEAFRLQEFFDSSSSTIPGARKIAIEQDKRIFGTNLLGKPNKRLNLEERRAFWSAYNEFKNMNPEFYFRNMGSNRIQQFIGDMITDSGKKTGIGSTGFTAQDFEELRMRLEGNRNYSEWERIDDGLWSRRVLSGKRSNKSK